MVGRFAAHGVVEGMDEGGEGGGAGCRHRANASVRGIASKLAEDGCARTRDTASGGEPEQALPETRRQHPEAVSNVQAAQRLQ